MKKVFLGVLSTVIVLSMCAVTAFAACPGGGRYFVDADGDGICDNTGSRCAYMDADGDGICDLCSARHGHWAGCSGAFVDADMDGVCDNCGSYPWCGTARAGGNFVDTDGNDTRDHCHSGHGRGCGYGRGAQGGRGNGFRGGRNK